MMFHFFKTIRTSQKIALDSLKRHKLRAALTILGVTVGITAVIVVLSAGRAIEDFILSQVTMWGTDWVEVEIKVPATAHVSAENVTGMAQGISITTMKIEDAEEIKKHPNVKDVYAGQIGQKVINYKDKNKITMFFGVTAAFDTIDPGEIAEGRFFTDEEDRGLAQVIVLGSKLKKNLFGDDNAIGEKVKINKKNYKVIGVMKDRGGVSFGSFSMDDIAYIPLRTLQKSILGIDHIQFILAQLVDNSLAEVTADDITTIMRQQHDIDDPLRDDFAVVTADFAMKMMSTVTGAIKILLFALACISLVVGGVGIMNVMYVAVAERTFEIGLRKAIGAKSHDILDQFLAEAITITFLGSVGGIIVGTVLSYLISSFANSLGFTWKFYISPQYIILAVGVSVLVGLISGIYPARAAARLEPMVALRKE